jgi:hypothetical protein
MVLTLELKPEVEAELARQAAAHGSALGAYAAALLEQAARLSVSAGRYDRERTRAAVARIRELRQGVTLGGLKIRDLIDKGRR